MKRTEGDEIVVTTTMSKAYQITVPSVIRKALGLEPGDPVDLKMEQGQAVLKRAETREEQVRRREGLSDETKAKIKKHAGWTINQYHDYYDNLPETKAYLKEKYGTKD